MPRNNRHSLKRHPIRLLLTFLCLSLLASCRSQPETAPTLPELVDATYSKAFKAQKAIENAANPNANPEEVETAENALDTEDDAPRFNIAANEVPTADFFLSLVQELDTNIVVHPEVTGTLSINLKNVTLTDILKAAQDIYGLHIEEENDVYFIYPAQLSTRIYQLNYINLKRTGSSSMSVASGQISSSGDSGTSSTSSGTEISTETEVDFWDGIENTLDSVLGTGDGREVVVNPHSGIVVIKANQAEHKAIEAFLNQAQANLQRQVVIEAKILEVTLSESFQSGVQWDALGTPGGTFPDEEGNLLTKAVQASQSSSSVINQQNSLDGIFSINLQLREFSSIIQMLETQGEVSVLSSPRISTVNNQKAVIKVGTDEFFVTEVSSNNSGATNETLTQTQDFTLTPFFSGIALDVTPQISKDHEVILHVHPTVSEVRDVEKTIDFGNGDIKKLPLAFSSIRESDSIIKARNNEIVILGGLLQSSEIDNKATTPWVSKIPIFGNLFRQKSSATEKSELVILLKPIVVENFTWRRLLEDSQNFLNQPKPRPKTPTTTVFK